MIQILSIIFVTIITDLYFFPIDVATGVNTKMIIAVFGLLVFMVKLAQKVIYLEKDYITLSLSALAVSLCGVLSMWYNDTSDTAYATYIVSMWVWLGGAYFVVNLIKFVHGKDTVLLLCNYLIAICVLQSVLALSIDMNPAVKTFVDSIYPDGTYYAKHERLYGIGAALDVAGSRFSAALIMIACIGLTYGNKLRKTWLALYVLSFLIIAVIGNMVARTTTIGVILSLAYLLFVTFRRGGTDESVSKKILWKWMIVIILLVIPVIVHYYKSNPIINDNMRFAFEGFFSLVEKGKWEVHSNDMLQNMYVFPDNTKTWIIGDGYFANPGATDQYYTGRMRTEYYMGTDVGYLRFIFYFGALGLIAFISFFGKATRLCMKRLKENKYMFVLFLILNLVVWFKVATDIFVVFAPFLCLSALKDEDGQELVKQ
ncbi:hypothetical protein [Prevotella sp.]|uniref:hypothetical protein n=1 Tax=Prevotella sp. TaxID=59823 RepID=UPI003AB6884A